jgi:hypothetical protein
MSIATHSQPAWRQDANHLLLVDLTEHGLPDRYEQLWVKKLESDLYQVCCIPFFLYGLALGDVVRAEKHRGHSVITELARRNGRSTIRVAANHPHEVAAQGLLHAILEERRPLNEWLRPEYVAIDAPTSAEHALLLSGLRAALEPDGVAVVEDATSIRFPSSPTANP